MSTQQDVAQGGSMRHNPAPRTTEEEWEEWPKEWIVRADLARELETELTEMKARAEKAEAALAAEREKVRVLLDAIKNCIDYANGNKYGWEDRVEGAFSYLYAALAAMKEVSK